MSAVELDLLSELVLAYEPAALARASRFRGRALPAPLERVASALREFVPHVVEDRPFASDLERVLALVRSGPLL
jgi:histidine ammonia-lyase